MGHGLEVIWIPIIVGRRMPEEVKIQAKGPECHGIIFLQQSGHSDIQVSWAIGIES